MFKKLFLIAFCFSLFFVAEAQNYENFSNLIGTKFANKDGLNIATVNFLHQSKEGYIWATSYEGILRFDGFEFKLFNKENTPILTSNTYEQIFENKQGHLYFPSSRGIAHYYKGHFDTLKTDIPLDYVLGMTIDYKDKIWGNSLKKGFFCIENGKVKIISDEAMFKNQEIHFWEINTKGEIFWGSLNGGLWVYKNDKFIRFGEKDGLHSSVIKSLVMDKDTLWVGTEDGLFKYYDNRFEFIEEVGKADIWVLSKKGTHLFVSTTNYLFQKIGNRFQIVTNPSIDGTPNNILEDKDGLFWFGIYKKGLLRLKNPNIYSFKSGLQTNNLVNTVLELSPTELLAGFDDGTMAKLKDKQWIPFQIKENLKEKRVRHLFKDNQSNLWISTYDGLLQIDKNNVETMHNKSTGFISNRFRLTFQDSKSRLWFGTRNEGLIIQKPDKSLFNISTREGLGSNLVMSIKEDAQGQLWVGTAGGGLNVVKNETVVKTYNLKNGLVSDIVFSTYVDAKNVVWVACNGGLSRIENDKITNYLPKHGLLNDQLYDIIESEDGSFWIPSNEGLLRLDKKNLNDFANGKAKSITCRLYDESDGLNSEGFTPTSLAIQTANDEIWFPALDGLLMVKLQEIKKINSPPPVYIENMIVDGQNIKLEQNSSVEAGKKHYQFRYTAIELYAPEKMRFKYKLEGFDNDWIEEDNKNRVVTYTNLSQGSYVFKVIACNADGIWNTVGDQFAFEIEPFFYETWWFRVFELLGLASLVFLVYSLRIRRLKEQQLILENMVEQRTQEIKQKNQHITDSINYAQKIQRAILPTQESIAEAFGKDNFFIVYKPRDIVSGDFYWFSQKEDRLIVAVADCTGHGVPGGFMSMIGSELLNHIVHDKEIHVSDLILNELHKGLIKALNQEGETEIADGMDIAIITINREKKQLEYAGAMNPIYVCLNGQLHVLNANKIAIGGGKEANKDTHFSVQVIDLPQDQAITLYLFSDGFQDQFGGKNKRKFMVKHFRNLLFDIHPKPMGEQQQILNNTLEQWIKEGDESQTDDITVMGIRV